MARLGWLLALTGGVGAWVAHRDEGISFRVQSREARSQNAIICIRQLHLIMEIECYRGPASILPRSGRIIHYRRYRSRDLLLFPGS